MNALQTSIDYYKIEGQPVLTNVDQGHNDADEILEQRERVDLEESLGYNIREYKKLEKNLNFLYKVDQLDINISDHFVNRDTKQKLIREHKGYTKLRGRRSLQESPDNQIGAAFETIYLATVKEVAPYI